jgi:hypothetical protein
MPGKAGQIVARIQEGGRSAAGRHRPPAPGGVEGRARQTARPRIGVTITARIDAGTAQAQAPAVSVAPTASKTGNVLVPVCSSPASSPDAADHPRLNEGRPDGRPFADPRPFERIRQLLPGRMEPEALNARFGSPVAGSGRFQPSPRCATQRLDRAIRRMRYESVARHKSPSYILNSRRYVPCACRTSRNGILLASQARHSANLNE